MEALVPIFIPLITIPFGIDGLTRLLLLGRARNLVLRYAIGGGLVWDVSAVASAKGRMTGSMV